eukprot:GILJ01006558.1.p1 GENE.GILJ01006558.1~~GILJ01006558.1.p1  ORF type:complete len:814 (-),score=130.82 GILJ01006558.1:164-2605(-)
MSGEVDVRELYPGLLLHRTKKENPDISFTFEIENKMFRICEFHADFTGSENFVVEGSPDLTKQTNIEPYEKHVVAVINVKDAFDGWKLKSKWSYALSEPARDKQKALLAPTIAKMEQELVRARDVLGAFPVDVAELADLRTLLQKNKMKYIDVDFPPSDKSLYPDPSNPPAETVVHWRRPEEFFSVDPARKETTIDIFVADIEPNDIKQGSLGDCWFMCALSALAERPELVKRLFITQSANALGVYRLKICKCGEWKVVTVDDLFPCSPNEGPIFSRAHGNELWVLLLEKAYAKLHGSYYLLRGGWAAEGLMDLTGCPSSNYNFADEDVQSLINSGEFWRMLVQWDADGYLMSASTPGEDRWTETGGNPNSEESRGLVPGHAYTVIGCHEVEGHQLLKIRNPWGSFEWNGDWSDNSPLWNHQLRQQVGVPEAADDGTFFMSLKDFLTHFYCANVCRVRNWDEIRLKGLFIKAAGGQKGAYSKWCYTMKVTEPTNMWLGLHQEDERIHSVEGRRGYIDLGMAIMKKTAGDKLELVHIAPSVIDRQCQLEITLDAGEYYIVPRTTGCYMRRPPEAVDETTHMLDSNRDLNSDAIMAITDIFRKYNMEIDQLLSFDEFSCLWEDIHGSQIAEADWQAILKKYCSTADGLSCRGLVAYFRDNALQQGESVVWQWFESLGYDRDFHSIRSRAFVLTVHSMSPIAMSVHELEDNFLDEQSTCQVIMQAGQHSDPTKGVVVWSSYAKSAHAYSYCVQNSRKETIEIKLDCSGSQNMIAHADSAVVTRKVPPGQTVFLLHMQAMKSVSNYCGGWKMSWRSC